ncbi:tyrosine-type recombinase/integrase [uncultured Paracoccus sp.]|uniref:tyrosine-type recombinase/integrase n=1 Tax=uncultured Paracoccus sp. TaxID=189685 RepID=UPI0026106DEE|nr:tyrosine-type recombinase/integrase [uncultured Paracoccus sp.]
MWARLVSQGGPLDERGGLAHVRTTTLLSLRTHYRHWLRWLQIADPEALQAAPEARPTVARLTAWLDDLAHTRPMTRLSYVQALLRVVSAHAPEQDWSGQYRLCAWLKHEAGRGDPSRKSGRILASEQLLSAGLTHAGTYADAGTTELERMKRRRDGTIVALLAIMPIRARSLAGLRLDRSIIFSADAVIIALDEALTKTGSVWESAVGAPVDALLRAYAEQVRPWLLARGGQQHDAFWVGKQGQPLTQGGVAHRIRTVTQARIGTAIPPHFFRDAAATTLARTSPDSARLIRSVLGHSGFRTAERHYNHAQTIDAGRNHASLIETLKGGRR